MRHVGGLVIVLGLLAARIGAAAAAPDEASRDANREYQLGRQAFEAGDLAKTVALPSRADCVNWHWARGATTSPRLQCHCLVSPPDMHRSLRSSSAHGQKH